MNILNPNSRQSKRHIAQLEAYYNAVKISNENDNLKIAFDNTKIVANDKNPFVFLKRQALEIQIHEIIAMNKRDDSNMIPWLPVLELLRTKNANINVTDPIKPLSKTQITRLPQMDD